MGFSRRIGWFAVGKRAPNPLELPQPLRLLSANQRIVGYRSPTVTPGPQAPALDAVAELGFGMLLGEALVFGRAPARIPRWQGSA
jgi:hypothetical protein